MLADLHCHSIVSDGALRPAELVARAAARGVELLALTDHDDVAGVPELIAAARASALRALAGVEVSASWQGHAVHIVGLAVDVACPALLAGLAAIRAGRVGRAERIAQALETIGFHGALEGARRHAAGASIVGRTHFARFLFEQGAARSVANVFDHYLAVGKPGYVPHQWAALTDAVDWIHAAGGVAVLAHPGRLRIGKAMLDELAADFRAAGGDAIEVVSGAHDPDHVRNAAALARRYGLLASLGSDFHAPEESACDLGAMAQLPDGLQPVWTRFA